MSCGELEVAGAGNCLGTASRKFRVLHRVNVILSLRRIRDPTVRREELRILRLRWQARFAQDDTALRDRVRNFRNQPLSVARLAAGRYSQRERERGGQVAVITSLWLVHQRD